MTIRRFHLGLLLIAVLAIPALLGCKSATPIGKLLDDPGSYEGKLVRVQGDVAGAAGALGYGAYTLDDGTGKILVVTSTGGAPREGARVGVEGTFRSAFTVGPHTGAVIQEEKRVAR
jgi:hypothetical protein